MELNLDQQVRAVTRILDLMERNPELMALANLQEANRPLIMTLFMRVAQYDAPKLTTEQMENCFQNALRNYYWNVEGHEEAIAEEERKLKEQEDEKWNGPTSGTLN